MTAVRRAVLRDLGVAAVRYAEAGLRVVPAFGVESVRIDEFRSRVRCSCGSARCREPGQHLRVPLRAASCDREVVSAWWRRHPGSNVALALGRGLVALRVGRNGGEGAQLELEEEGLALPPTVTIQGPEARVLLFRGRAPSARLGPGLDLLGAGGFVLLPPSRTSGRYFRDDERAGLAELPSGLVRLARSAA